MSIEFNCPSCGYSIKAPDKGAGRKGKCPGCGGVVTVPAVSASPPVVGANVVEAQVVEAQAADDADSYKTFPVGDIPAGPTDPNRRPCPSCGEQIATAALKCRFCNEVFDPELKKREKAKSKPSFIGGEGDSLSVGEWVVALLCSGIGCIIGIIWVVQGKPKGKKMLLISLCMQIFWVLVRVAIETANSR
jgi:hypothetical protein